MRLQDIHEGQWVQVDFGVVRRISGVIYQDNYGITLHFLGSHAAFTFTAEQVSLWEAVDITFAPKPVSGTVAIIKGIDGVYRAEKGRLLTNGHQLDERFVTRGDKIVARLTWTEGDGL